MTNKHSIALFAALFAIHCGNAVSPTADAAHDASSDAATPAATVTFVATTHVAVNPSPVAGARVRAETAEGRVVEGMTDAQGRVELALTAGLRWDVTFAHRETQVVSILGLRPEAVQRDVAVWMDTLYEFRAHAPNGRMIYRDAPTQRVRLSLQPRMRGTSATVGHAVVNDRRYSFDGASADLLYQRTDDRGIDVVVIESEEEAIRETYSRPLRMIHRRIEPTPQTDIDLALDINDALPVEPEAIINVWPPTEGLITASTATPFIRSTMTTIEATDPWSDTSHFIIGTLARMPPTELTPWRLRVILASRELVRSDEQGPLVSAYYALGTIDGADGGLLVSVQPNVLSPRDVTVPVLHRLAIVGTSLRDLRIEARGAYEQLGFEVINLAPRAPSLVVRHWVGWNFDPMDPTRVDTLRIPHLPGGITLGALQQTTDGPLSVNAVVSTLPHSRPAYGFWRDSQETVRVLNQRRDLSL